MPAFADILDIKSKHDPSSSDAMVDALTPVHRFAGRLLTLFHQNLTSPRITDYSKVVQPSRRFLNARAPL